MAVNCTRTAFSASVFLFATLVVVAASPQTVSQAASRQAKSTTIIPGPLQPFLRMAAVSTKVSPEEVLPLVARNVFTQGYDGRGTNRQTTEYMILLKRYVQQARELRALAGSDGVIRVPSCDGAGKLLAVLGYRLRQGCGKQASVETADANRAFVTLNSAFPLTDLEDALRSGKPFAYTYPATDVPLLFSRDDWLPARTSKQARSSDDVLDAILNDPSLARLYWAMARLDGETRETLRTSLGLRALLPYAPVLDFYGSQIMIRSGHASVPGGQDAESAWQQLVGASPRDGAQFAQALVSKDAGWPAALYDVLSRTDAARQRYFTEPSRLSRFYGALRVRDTSIGPAHAVFRTDTSIFFLVSRLNLDTDDKPMIPGGVDIWNHVLRKSLDRSGAKTADDLVAVLFHLARNYSTPEMVQLFLSINEMDRGRSQHLIRETVKLLAEKFPRFRDQYPIFCEFRALNDESIHRFLTVAESLDHIRDQQLRADAIGMFQANVGLWQILARQGQISSARQNESWLQTLAPFNKLHSAPQLFDAGHASLRAVLQAAGGKADLAQDEVISLLAGPKPSTSEATQMHDQLADDIAGVLVSQRLVPLDTVFAFRDALDQLAIGKKPEGVQAMAERLREFELPRPLFTGGERAEWSNGVKTSTTHDEAQTHTDWLRIVSTPQSSAELEKARGRLAPILRDTLVGLNYAYYAPPGAQMVHNNALFVRSHDFSGSVMQGGGQSWQTPLIMGSGTPTALGARLVGSLADLPYVLAQVEQDFIIPENAQALILDETAPTLISSAIVPRWWHVSHNELHAAALYQRAGEDLLRSATQDAQTRERALGILSECMYPARAQQFRMSLPNATADNMPELAPLESFYLGYEFLRRFPDSTNSLGATGQELQSLIRDHPDEVSWERLSQDFGVPHPALGHTYGRALLVSKPWPAIMDFGSRLFAESWQSNNLYWARLADERGYSAVALNRLVPRLTRRMLEKIYATDLADWPALLRALRETGDEFRRTPVEPRTGPVAAR